MTANKWFLSKPTLIDFDNKLQHYYQCIEEIQKQSLIRDQDFIELSIKPLASAIEQHTLNWIAIIGKLLYDSARENLFSLKGLFEVSVLLFLIVGVVVIVNIDIVPGLLHCLLWFLHIYIHS